MADSSLNNKKLLYFLFRYKSNLSVPVLFYKIRVLSYVILCF